MAIDINSKSAIIVKAICNFANILKPRLTGIPGIPIHQIVARIFYEVAILD